MIIFSEKILDNSECNIIADYILSNEERIKKLGPDNYPGTHENSLTGRHPYFNYLNTKEIGDILIPKLKKIFRDMELKTPVSIQCWANTFRKDQGIKYHEHGPPEHTFLCGNIFICGPTKPGTSYKIDGEMVDIENEPGVLSMFNSHVGHMVKPNSTDQIRISMAIDVVPFAVDRVYHSNPNRFFVMHTLEDFNPGPRFGFR